MMNPLKDVVLPKILSTTIAVPWVIILVRFYLVVSCYPDAEPNQFHNLEIELVI